jgi:hypothetical protein
MFIFILKNQLRRIFVNKITVLHNPLDLEILAYEYVVFVMA